MISDNLKSSGVKGIHRANPADSEIRKRKKEIEGEMMANG
jgi:hypothetical protein